MWIGEKITGSFLLISHLYLFNILTYNDLLHIINYLYIDNDNYDYIINSILNIIKLIYKKLNNNDYEKLKKRIEYLSKNLNNSRLKFNCLDILDIINIK